VDPDDARELFVAAWCLHPLVVPEQKLLVIPEPREPHDLGILFLREHEIIHSELPVLRYLAHMRVVKYQDWDASSSSDDDGFPAPLIPTTVVIVTTMVVTLGSMMGRRGGRRSVRRRLGRAVAPVHRWGGGTGRLSGSGSRRCVQSMSRLVL
jgi:hypothetical protein